MTIGDLLPWANLLLAPAVWELMKIREALGALSEVTKAHAERIKTAEGDIRDMRRGAGAP